MKTALIADLHANREAVGAVLGHARRAGAERYVFLGDYVGYGADPAWVLDTVMAHVADGALAVLGNHDEAVLSVALAALHPDAARVIHWTREQLRPEHLRFIESLPHALQDGETLYVHANAQAPAAWGYIHDGFDAQRSFQATSCRRIFCGHVHEPALFESRAAGPARQRAYQAGMTLPLAALSRWLALPGSAGQPRDGNPDACYALYDDASTTSLAFHRVPYDTAAAAARLRAAGFPRRMGQRLIDGL